MPHSFKGRTGVDRLVHASRNSAAGLRAAWRFESAFRQESVLALVMLPLACWLGNSWVDRCLLAGSVLLVLVVELLNSGIEAVVDRIGLEFDELSGRAKDYGSAAVMVALLACGLIWATFLVQRVAP